MCDDDEANDALNSYATDPIPYKNLIILFKRCSEVISFLLYQEKKRIGFFYGFSIIDSTIYIPIKLAIMVTHGNKTHLI